MRVILILVLSVLATQVVAQEDWSDVETGRLNGSAPNGATKFLSNGVTLDDRSTNVAATAISITFPNDPPANFGGSFLRLSDFARSRSVEALEVRISDLEQNSASLAQFDALRTETNRQANRSIALASALRAPSPAPGATFRAGVELGYAGDEQAVGINLGARRGKFDFSASGAFAKGASAARAGAGISW